MIKKSFYESYVKDYQKTPKGIWGRQKANAKRRGLKWEIPFETWWKMWQDSGKWEQRGTGRDCYVMGRNDDQGHYTQDNVKIISVRQNCMEGLSKTTFNFSTPLRKVSERQSQPKVNIWPLNWNTPEARQVNSFLGIPSWELKENIVTG
jgi:hypothetical protein